MIVFVLICLKIWVLETVINIIAFLKGKLVFCRYNKMVRCSSPISLGKFFCYQGENLVLLFFTLSLIQHYSLNVR